MLRSFFSQAKLKYIFILFLTQAFLPILQKEWANYLLFIPLVVINLLSDWIYQVDFGFQYSYGSNTLTLFLSILALEALWQRFGNRNQILASKRIVSLISYCQHLLSRYPLCPYQPAGTTIPSATSETARDLTTSSIPCPLSQETRPFWPFIPIPLHFALSQLYDVFYHNEQKYDDKIDIIVVPRSITENTESKEYEIIIPLSRTKAIKRARSLQKASPNFRKTKSLIKLAPSNSKGAILLTFFQNNKKRDIGLSLVLIKLFSICDTIHLPWQRSSKQIQQDW